MGIELSISNTYTFLLAFLKDSQAVFTKGSKSAPSPQSPKCTGDACIMSQYVIYVWRTSILYSRTQTEQAFVGKLNGIVQIRRHFALTKIFTNDRQLCKHG